MCGCRSEIRSGRTSVGLPVRAPIVPATPPAPTLDRVMLTYLGHAPRLVLGPATGSGYAVFPQESIPAHPADAGALIAGGSFQRVDDAFG